MIYCDHCAEPLQELREQNWVTSLPRDIDSANKGESGVVCEECYVDYLELKEII